MSKVNLNILRDTGLDQQKVLMHERRIEDFLAGKYQEPFSLIEPCTIENGMVISEEIWSKSLQEYRNKGVFSEVSADTQMNKRIATVILAAGAATRFLHRIASFCEAIEVHFLGIQLIFESIRMATGTTHIGGSVNISEELTELDSSLIAESGRVREFLESDDFGEKSEAFRRGISEILDIAKRSISKYRATSSPSKKFVYPARELEKVFEAYITFRFLLENCTSLPKALVPVGSRLECFLDFNIWQQAAILPGSETTIVVAVGTEVGFKQKMENSIAQGVRDSLMSAGHQSYSLLEQGMENSTIRFTAAAEPLLEPNGKYSVVAGGHGEIVNHFNFLSDRIQSCNCLHIRTVDNIFGNCEQVNLKINSLKSFFYAIKLCLDSIRTDVQKAILLNIRPAQETIEFSINSIDAIKILNTLVSMDNRLRLVLTDESSSGNTLLKFEDVLSLLGAIFHFPQMEWPKSSLERLTELNKILLRPLSVLGVVAREQSDVGGIPVIASNSLGEKVRICAESARLTPGDRDRLFGGNGLVEATHFNAALAFVESRMMDSLLPNDGQHSIAVDFSQLTRSEIFLISKKIHNGEPVFYHEVAMFELLSHSDLVNAIYVEVPRLLFKPHKDIFDIIGKSREQLGFHPRNA